MALYQLLLVPKFLGVLLFAGGMGAAFAPLPFEQRKLAVHQVASLGLMSTWVCGYLAASSIGISGGELWLIGSLLLSALSHGVLVWSVLREGRRTVAVFSAASAPLLVTLCLMIAKPTWARVLG